MTDPVLTMRGVGLVRDGTRILDGIDFSVAAGERWVVLGPNGCGKTSLLRIASLYLHPTAGTIVVLGTELGRADIRPLRPRIGFTSSGLADMLRPGSLARDIVMTARNGALEPWWHDYDDADRLAAQELLDRLGVGQLSERTFATLSSGERQRVLLARTLSTDPALVLLDEPTAGLDLAGREDLIMTLADLADDATTPPVVLVTHHVEEIPPGFTHVLMMRAGAIHASGPLPDTLTASNLSGCFGVPLELTHQGGRYSAWRLPSSG